MHAGSRPCGHAVVAERALEYFPRLRAELRNVEGAARDAVAAADAIRFLKIDDSVGVLHDRAVRRARLKAAGILAVHALILAHQKHQAVFGIFVLVELDQVPVIPRRFGHGLVGIVEGSFGEWISVPFQAGHFACFAADARGRVDQLADLIFAVQAGARNGAGMP